MDWCWWLGCAAVDVICMYTMNLLLAALSIFTHPGLLADHTSMYITRNRFYDRLCKDPFPRGAISNFLQYDWSIVIILGYY